MNQLISWLNWFNRQKIIFLIGFVVLCLGAVFPWYQLPPQGLDTFKVSFIWSHLGRFLVAIIAILGFATFFYYRINQFTRTIFWITLTIVLLFPYCMTTWQPTISFLSLSYYNQGISVSRHIDRNFSEVQSQWKQGLTLNRSKPVDSIVGLTISDSRFFQLPSWENIWIDGFGYNNSFFSFIGKGWSFSIVGLITCLAGFYLEEENNELHKLLTDLKFVLPSAVMLISVIVSFLVWVNIVDYGLGEKFAKGEYQEVISVSRKLTIAYPPLNGDTLFMERMAKASLYSNQPEPALINFAKGLEHFRVNDFDQSVDYFRLSLAEQDNNFLVRGYLASALINQGVDYFNNLQQLSGRRAGGALDIFDQTLQIFPNHIECLYSTMIARVINGEFDKSAQIAKRIIENNKYFQSPNNSLLGQAYLHMSWDNFAGGNMAEAWKLYRQSIDDSLWKNK